MDIFKLVVTAALLAILGSLGVALFHLTTGKGDSSKMLRALTWRISLSVALLALLVFASHQGWITPHAFAN